MKMFNKVANWHRANRTAAALNSLSSRQLEDIGLAPGDIRTISRIGR